MHSHSLVTFGTWLGAVISTADFQLSSKQITFPVSVGHLPGTLKSTTKCISEDGFSNCKMKISIVIINAIN